MLYKYLLLLSKSLGETTSTFRKRPFFFAPVPITAALLVNVFFVLIDLRYIRAFAGRFLGWYGLVQNSPQQIREKHQTTFRGTQSNVSCKSLDSHSGLDYPEFFLVEFTYFWCHWWLHPPPWSGCVRAVLALPNASSTGFASSTCDSTLRRPPAAI